MNGRFGVNPTAAKIKRTTSISEFVNHMRNEEMGYVVPVAAGSGCAGGSNGVGGPLTRTCSLPMETEEECRKRKELQTLRMEARRKRSEKQRNMRTLRERSCVVSEERFAGSIDLKGLMLKEGASI